MWANYLWAKSRSNQVFWLKSAFIYFWTAQQVVKHNNDISTPYEVNVLANICLPLRWPKLAQWRRREKISDLKAGFTPWKNLFITVDRLQTSVRSQKYLWRCSQLHWEHYVTKPQSIVQSAEVKNGLSLHQLLRKISNSLAGRCSMFFTT